MDNLDLTGSLRSTFYFIGSMSELPAKCNYGDVCICNGIQYVWTNKWLEIGSYKEETYTEIELPKKMEPWICERCGAPMRSSKCGYCDTQYF